MKHSDPAKHDLSKETRRKTVCRIVCKFYFILIFDMETAVIGVASKLVKQAGELLFGNLLISDDSRIDDREHGVTLGERLTEQIREGCSGCETTIPRVTPDLMVEVQTLARIFDFVRDELLRGDRTPAKQAFNKSDFISLGAVGVCECPASETDRKDGSVDHRRGYLKVVAVSDRIVRLIDTFGQKTGDKLHLHSI